jgi:hypothetical protein
VARLSPIAGPKHYARVKRRVSAATGDGLPGRTGRSADDPEAGVAQRLLPREVGAVERLDGRRHLINAQAAGLGDLADSDLRSGGLVQQTDHSRQDREVAVFPGGLDRLGALSGADLVELLLEGVQVQGVLAELAQQVADRLFSWLAIGT